MAQSVSSRLESSSLSRHQQYVGAECSCQFPTVRRWYKVNGSTKITRAIGLCTYYLLQDVNARNEALIQSNLQALPFLGEPFLQPRSHMRVNALRLVISFAGLFTDNCTCIVVPLDQSLDGRISALATMRPRSLCGELCESTERTSDVESETGRLTVSETVVANQRHDRGRMTLSKGKKGEVQRQGA